MSEQERFVAIEIKLAHQEDLVDSLNDVVYQQTRRIDQLEAMVNALAEHIRNASHTTPGAGPHEVPPHY
ncbi:SlyX family protein [Massilia sp. DWR3-1-1]|uniref:SlyX family protein n=1 Tax=Massilia sp. DWR3-1-1 TaxID=2804559 RepID=UPI003CF463BC